MAPPPNLPATQYSEATLPAWTIALESLQSGMGSVAENTPYPRAYPPCSSPLPRSPLRGCCGTRGPFQGALHLLRAVQMLIGAAEELKGFHYLALFAQIIGIGVKRELPVIDRAHQLAVGALARGVLCGAGSSYLGFQRVPLRSQPLVELIGELPLTDIAVLQRIPRHLEFSRERFNAPAEHPQILISEQCVVTCSHCLRLRYRNRWFGLGLDSGFRRSRSTRFAHREPTVHGDPRDGSNGSYSQ